MCKNWIESEGRFCRYGDKCQFAHGIIEMKHRKDPVHKNYKSKECVSFYGKNFCPYGKRCMFMHEERSLEDVRSFYYIHYLSKLEASHS